MWGNTHRSCLHGTRHHSHWCMESSAGNRANINKAGGGAAGVRTPPGRRADASGRHASASALWAGSERPRERGQARRAAALFRISWLRSWWQRLSLRGPWSAVGQLGRPIWSFPSTQDPIPLRTSRSFFQSEGPQSFSSPSLFYQHIQAQSPPAHRSREGSPSQREEPWPGHLLPSQPVGHL